MFVWLGIALGIDGIDGTFARRLQVAKLLPRWSGDVLDLVVDILNYVFVPAYALAASGLLPKPAAIPLGLLIVVTGALYFADRMMKTSDYYFRGFPALWNVAAFYLFILKPEPWVGAAAIIALAALTGALSFKHAKPGLIRDLIMERTDPVLFGYSYDYVGDLSETVALMWPKSSPLPPRAKRVAGREGRRPRCAQAAATYGATLAAPEEIHAQHVDVFVPAALGAVLNDATIPGLRCRVVCGGANNQLAEARHDAALAVRGIVFVPDYLANAGGVIDFHQETIDDQPDAVLASVARIGDITRGVLRCAAATGATPLSVADGIVRARIIRRA